MEHTAYPCRKVALFTDPVGLPDLKGEVGTEGYSHLVARHRELFHQAVRVPAGREPRDRADPPRPSGQRGDVAAGERMRVVGATGRGRAGRALLPAGGTGG